MRHAAPLAAAFALVACGQPQPEPGAPAESSGGQVSPAPGAAASAAGANPLGAGSSMSGRVSGLSGLVTAFEVQETATQIIVELAADVLFAFDSADLSPQAPEQLRKTVAQIQRGGSGDIRVVGHTDSQGEDAYNDALSLRRAQAVARWLSTEGGVPAARLKSEGRGERDPVAPNAAADGADDPQGRAKNRRVQVIIPKG